MASRKALKDAFEIGEDKTAFEHLLINLVQPVKFIWDTKDGSYKNKMKRQNAFTTIGVSLNKSAEVCTAVWESLRSQYFACRRKIPSGSGADVVPSFRHYSAMQFLSDNVTCSKTLCSMNYEDSEKQDSIQIEIVNEPSPESEIIAEVVIPEEFHAAPSAVKSYSKYNGKRKPDPIDQEMLRYLKSINAPKADDEFDAFGKVIASKLRKLSACDKKVAAECELEVHKLICEAEMKLS